TSTTSPTMPMTDPSLINNAIYNVTSPGTGMTNTSAGAGTGSNTANYSSGTSTTTPDYDNPANWGPWAQTAFSASQGGGNIQTIISSTTGAALLTTDLTTISPAIRNFGVVNYNGSVFGTTQLAGGATTPGQGSFN